MLHSLSFEVKSGERIGIGEPQDRKTRWLDADEIVSVGRTGSGKASRSCLQIYLI